MERNEPDRDVPDDPLARAIFDWLDPERFGSIEIERAPDSLISDDKERWRRLISESGKSTIPPMPKAPPPPYERVGNYRLRAPIGSGGFGHVYLGEDERNGKRVAVKLLRAEIAIDPRERERFQREATAARRVNHPNCVRVLETGEIENSLYTVLEIIEGEGLDEHLRRLRAIGQKMTQERATEIGIEICDALAAVHAEGLVHRDVKPANIRLTREGRAVLVDFGLATGEALAVLTRTGEFIGSLPYAPPEQIRDGVREVDARADLYSLAASLYECLTGQTVFTGASAEQLVLSIVQDEPISPQRLNPQVSREASLVLGKALEKNAARRYATAKDFQADLLALKANEQVSARPRSLMRGLELTIRKRPVFSVSVALFLVVGIGLPLALFIQQKAYAARLRGERDRADSQRLAALSQIEIDVDPARAGLLALASIDRSPSFEGRNALLRALSQMNEKKTIHGPWQRLNYALAVGDGTAAVALERNGDLYSIDLKSGAVVRRAGPFDPNCMLATTSNEALVGTPTGVVERFALDDFRKLEPWTVGKAPILAIAATHDGHRAVVACGRAIVFIEDGVQKTTLSPHAKRIGDVAISQNGDKGFSVGADGKLFEFDTASGKFEERLSFGETEPPRLCLSRDDSLLACGTDTDVALYDVAKHSLRQRIGGHYGQSTVLTFSPKADYLVASTSRELPALYRVSDGERMIAYRGHTDRVKSISFLGDSLRILTCGSELDSTLRIYSPRSVLDDDVVLNLGGDVFYLEPARDFSAFIAGEYQGTKVKRVELDSDQLVWEFGAGDPTLDRVRSMRHGDVFIVVRNSGALEFRRIADGAIVETVQGVATNIEPHFDERRNRLLASIDDNLVALDAKSGAVLRKAAMADGAKERIHGFSIDADVLLGATDSGRIVRIDPETLTMAAIAQLESGLRVLGMEIDAQHDRFVAQVVNMNTFALRLEWFAIHSSESLGRTPTVTSHIWHTHGFAAEGNEYVYSIGGSLHLLSLIDGSERTIANPDTVNTAGVSGDDRLVAIGTTSGSIRVVDHATLKAIVDLPAHVANVNKLVFHGDDHMLYSASSDGTVRRWRIDRLVENARGVFPRELSREEREHFEIEDHEGE